MSDPLLTVAEVAEKLRLTVRTVYNMIKDGELAAIHLNPRTIRIKASALADYIATKGAVQCR